MFEYLCMRGIASVPLLQERRKPVYRSFHAQLFSNRFLVTKTHSQDFKHAYAYNLTATEQLQV